MVKKKKVFKKSQVKVKPKTKTIVKKPKAVVKKALVKKPQKKELKKLVVFYSFDGNTKFIAEEIAKAINADLMELKTRQDLLPRNFTKYFWGGKMVMMKEKPDLLLFKNNPFIYDVIFIGTPVWAYNFAPPLRTFFNKISLRDKDVALFCCHGGSKGKTLSNMAHELKGNKILGEIDFKEPLKTVKMSTGKKAREWAMKIIKEI